MQNTMVRRKKPLIARDDSATKVKTTQYTSSTGNEPLITLDDLASHKVKLLMQKLFNMVILVNLMVLISIVLCT
ncbi:MAG: hypothetical protein GY845_19150 [Planctomycetes bacterium]|nr:hypothetical protein [Planctomycetota bacterium]